MFAKERVQISFEVDVELSQITIDNANSTASRLNIDEIGNTKELTPIEKYLLYHVEIEMHPQSASLRIADESLVALDSSGNPKTKTPLLDRKHILRDVESTRGMFAPFSFFSFFSPPNLLQYWDAMRQELSNWFFSTLNQENICVFLVRLRR